ncbi:metal-sulfur cluster assembly factor [Anaerobacillus alkaliphilus]|uniref:Metal-sulfur cluster assembly factor n=1 Tax=Anaerobacillus alkaliphilus TaxID=1548597 RepID=A0A4Q0VS28_9BACI|nr:metal-sulfur cluster assembly factor [Anaerobacillus alkaliphilus]
MSLDYLVTKEEVTKALRKVIDPELGVDVVGLGLIYEVTIQNEGLVLITMTLTTPGCPLHDTLVNGVKSAVQSLPTVEKVDVNLVWEPEWSPEKMSPEIRKLFF